MIVEGKKSVKKAYLALKPVGRLFFPNYRTIVLVYVLVLSLFSRERISGFFAQHFGNYLVDFNLLLNTRAWANWATTVFLIISGSYLFKCQYVKKKQYGWTIIISLFLFLYLLLDDSWIWSKTPLLFNYKILLILICIALLSCGIIHLWQLIKEAPRLPKEGEKKSVGFAVTTTQDSLQETGWQPYIENLVSKLLVTDISKESFAVGISGVWGSGKTTFLKAAEQELKQRVYLLTFNPWNGETASQISTDFFETLVSGLCVTFGQRKTIKRYAKLLSQVEALKSQARLLETVLEGVSPSLAEAKEQAEKVIATMPLPVGVIIDDLDRLEGAELMSVLKLIRITANFKNLFFLVAYDKDHIANLLKGVGGEEFLKKIIPLEICLPDYESYIREYHLYSELKRGLANDTILKEIDYDIFRGTPNHKTSFYLPTFRDVKRFANQFCLDINSFVRTNTLSEISISDFYFVELLHYYDFKAYQYLKSRPQALIPRTTNTKGKPVYSFMTPGTISGVKAYEDADEKKRSILAQFNEGFEDILWKLFGSTAIDEMNQIRYPVNFAKYFSFRINNDQISLNEFDSFLTITDASVIDRKIKDYCRVKPTKRNSLYNHLISQSLDPNNKRQVFNVVYSLIELWKFSPYSIDEVGKTLLDKQANKDPGIIPVAFKEAVKAQIGTSAYVANGIQMLLTALVSYYFIDQSDENGGYAEYESIISEDILRELSEANFMSVLGDREMPIQDITDKTSLFHQFIKRAVAKIGYAYIGDNATTEFKQSLLVWRLKDLYSGKDNSSGLDIFFRNLDPRAYSPENYNYPEEFLDEEVASNISSVFGDYWGFKDFNGFIKSAFAGHLKDVNVCLKKLNREPIEETLG